MLLFFNALFFSSSLPEVRIVQPSHEGIGAVGPAGSDASGELGVALAKLVDLDGHHMVAVVEGNVSLKSEKVD